MGLTCEHWRIVSFPAISTCSKVYFNSIQCQLTSNTRTSGHWAGLTCEHWKISVLRCLLVPILCQPTVSTGFLFPCKSLQQTATQFFDLGRNLFLIMHKYSHTLGTAFQDQQSGLEFLLRRQEMRVISRWPPPSIVR